MLQVLRDLLLLAVGVSTIAVLPSQAHVTAREAPATSRLLADYQRHVYSERREVATIATVGAWTDQVNTALAEAERQRQEEAARAKAAAEAAAAAAAAATASSPQPRPAPPPPRDYGAGSIQDMIRQIFGPLGPSAVDWGLRVAACESGYNPRAGYPNGPYYGVFQFALQTFRNTVYGNQDVFDPFYNISAAAWKYSIEGGRAWGCK